MSFSFAKFQHCPHKPNSSPALGIVPNETSLQAFCDEDGDLLSPEAGEDREKLEFELDKEMRLFYRHTSALGHQCVARISQSDLVSL